MSKQKYVNQAIYFLKYNECPETNNEINGKCADCLFMNMCSMSNYKKLTPYIKLAKEYLRKNKLERICGTNI